MRCALPGARREERRIRERAFALIEEFGLGAVADVRVHEPALRHRRSGSSWRAR